MYLLTYLLYTCRRYIQVDIYGGCGTMSCLRTEFDRCRKILNNDYKFYLSFENSNCDYYITEKFYENGLRSVSREYMSCILSNKV